MGRQIEGIGRRDNEQTSGFAVRRKVAPKRQWGRLIFRLSMVFAGLTAVATGGWWLLTTPVFAVTRVESGSYRFTSKEELEGVLSRFLHHNIWTLSTTEVEAELAELPWVRDLRVGRRLPKTLEVDFREWRPQLVVHDPGNDGSTPQVLIADGRVLDFPAHLRLAGLPVLVGVAVTTEPEGKMRRLETTIAGQVLDLITAIEISGLESVSPIDFLVARPEGFAIVLQTGHGTLLVGREDFTNRLDRYMTARDHIQAETEVDLRFEDRITIK